jgi:hypothetical protein
MKINANLDTKLDGRFKIAVVKADGTERFPIGKGYHKNLILNSGLDLFFTHYTQYSPAFNTAPSFSTELSANCRIGTGTTAVSPTDVALVNPVRWQSAYNEAIGVPGGGNACQTIYDLVAGSCTHRRTYDYPTEVGTVIYTELGIAPLQTGNLFSRIVISPVTVNAGEQLRVVYELTITIAQYITPTAASGSSGTFDCAGNLKFVGQLASLFGAIGTDGLRVNGWKNSIINGFASNPSWSYYPLYAWLTVHSAFPASDTNLAISYLAGQYIGANSVYVAGSFTKYAEWIFSAVNPVSTVSTVNSIIITPRSSWSGTSDPQLGLFPGHGLQLLLNGVQTKQADYKLTLQFTWTASR